MSVDVMISNFDPVLEKAIANGAVKMSKALRQFGDCASFDIEKMFTTRAWGRDKRKAGAAMSEMRTGGAARRMLTMDQVLELVPIHKSTLKRMLKKKTFPAAHYITPNKPVWYEDEIFDWQETLPAKSGRKRGRPAQGSSGEAR